MSSDIRIGSKVRISGSTFRSIFNGHTGIVTLIADSASIYKVAFDSTQFNIFRMDGIIDVLDIEEYWFPGEMLQLIKEETKMSENRSGRYPWPVEGLYVCGAVPGNMPDDAFTVGKEYMFVNGRTLDDKGCVRPLGMDGIPVSVMIHDDPEHDDWTPTWFKNHKFKAVQPLDKDLLKKLLKMIIGCDRDTNCLDCRKKHGVATNVSCGTAKREWATSLLEALEPKPDPLEKWKGKLSSEAYDILKEIIESDHDRRITICFKQPYLKTWRVGVLKGFNPENGELDIKVRKSGHSDYAAFRIELITDLQRWKGGLCASVVSRVTVGRLRKGRIYSMQNGKVVIPADPKSGKPGVRIPALGYIRSEEDQYFKDNFVMLVDEQPHDIFERVSKKEELATGEAVYVLRGTAGITQWRVYQIANGKFIDNDGVERPFIGNLVANSNGPHSLERYGFRMLDRSNRLDPQLPNGRAIQATPVANRHVGTVYLIRNGEVVNDDLTVEKIDGNYGCGLLLLDESDD